MRSLFLAVVAAVAVALVLGPGAGAVAAQDSGNQTPTVNESVNGSAEYVEKIDSRLDLVGHGWTGDGFELEFRSDGRSLVTITQSVQRAEGAGKMSITQQALPDGRSTVFIPMDPIAGEAAVAITTAESIDEGTGTYVSTGIQEPGPWTRVSSGAAWLGGLSIAFGMTIWAGIKKRRQDDKVPEEVS